MKEKPSLKLSKISRLEFISLVAPWLALSLPIFFYRTANLSIRIFFSSKWCRQTEGKKIPGYFCLFLQDIKPFPKHSIKTKVHFKNTILILGTCNPIPHSLKIYTGHTYLVKSYFQKTTVGLLSVLLYYFVEQHCRWYAHILKSPR